MKRILRIAKRDLKAGMRDYMVIYMLVFPFILAIILQSMTHSAEGISLRLAVDDTVPVEKIEQLEEYATVEKLSNTENLRRRVLKQDDIMGVTGNNGEYQIIAQGNEREDASELIGFLLEYDPSITEDLPFEVRIGDLGWKLSPLKQYGGGLMVVFMSVLGGMVLLINLVEEKTQRTLAALNVSPIKRWEFVLGKSVMGFALPLIHGFGILLILGFSEINYLLLLPAILSISMISVLLGFAIGVTNDNILGAISSLKIVFIPLLGSVFGMIFLAEKWHPFLYPSPFYWAFRSVNDIILNRASWGSVLFDSMMVLIITAFVFLLLRKRIQRGLD